MNGGVEIIKKTGKLPINMVALPLASTFLTMKIANNYFLLQCMDFSPNTHLDLGSRGRHLLPLGESFTPFVLLMFLL